MSVAWTDTTHEIAGSKLHLARAAAAGRCWCCITISARRTACRSTMRWRAASMFWCRTIRAGASRSGRNGCATRATSRRCISWLLAELGLSDVSLVGLGFGGWIAAEMASQAPTAYRRLVLVGAMGIKPPEGDIADQAIVSYIDYPQAGFHDAGGVRARLWRRDTDQLEQWDICREMVFRTAWKPYMYSQTLPHLLGGVQAPALVVWGDDDRHVPQSAGRRLCAGAARRAAGNRGRLRTLCGYGEAGRAGQAGHRFVNAN